MRALAAAASVLLIVFWVLKPATFVGLNVFDEGFLASGALEILRGGLPMRDFFVIYGPGAYYMNAAAFALFGEDLAVLRYLHLAWMALAALMLVGLTRRITPHAPSWSAALICAVFLAFATSFPPSPGYAAIPAAVLVMLAVAELPQARFDASRRGLWLASVWLGLAGLVRWDFGILGFLAVAAAWLLSRPVPAWRGLVQLALPGLALALTLFLPFVWLGDAQRWWQEVPLFHLREFKEWRNLAFIGPHLELLQRAGNRWELMQVLLRWAAFLMPFVLVAAALPVAARRLLQRRATPADLLAAGLALASLALLNQQRVRTGLNQGFPALLLALPLAAYLGGLLAARMRWLPALGGGLATLLILYAALPEFQSLRARTVPVTLERNGGWRVYDSPAWQARAQDYVRLVQRLRELVPPGERLFSGVRDTSRLWVNDAMLYFLADRRAATRWIEMEPGLTNAAVRQPGVVAELQRHSPPWVVLWDMQASEPNRTAQSNGESQLDQFVRERYMLVEQLGEYQLWQRR
ncbi:MAG: ArnT family glycosyltransferase [Roseateles sp.]